MSFEEEAEKRVYGISDTDGCLDMFREYSRVKQMLMDIPAVVEKSGTVVLQI